jgi:chemotaxis protein MotA
MDITTILGAGSILTIIVLGIRSGELPAFLINWHGIMIVLGGTAAAMLINTPGSQLVSLWRSVGLILRGSPYPPKTEIVDAIVGLAERVQSRGVTALGEADPAAINGDLARAAAVAVEYNDPILVEQILEMEINTTFDLNTERSNLFRTASVLAPMFGLLGTLIGIVSVLKEISNPDNVGHAMAVAMTTAFYGIALANAVFVPIAGKLRSRCIEQLRAQSMISDGIVMMMRGVVPLAIGRKLQAYR